jgi:cell shape-determining protein MreC
MFSSMSRRRVVVLLVLSCLLLITLDQRGSPAIDRARDAFAVVLQPFDAAAEAAAQPFANVWRAVTDYDDLERRNRELEDRIAQQAGAEIEWRADILEYQELLKLYGLDTVGNYQRVTARVIGDAPSNFQNTVEINKGSDHGLLTGMAVVDGAGLVGRLTSVTRDRAVVLLITDPSFSVQAEVLVTEEEIPLPDGSTTTTVPAETTTTADTTTTVAADPAVPVDTAVAAESTTTLESTTTTTAPPEVLRETGLLAGQGSRHPLQLGLIDDSATTSNVRVGSVVKTAGGESSLAPQGIPIGYVTRVSGQSGQRTPLIEVTPNSQLDQLYYVNVVLYVPGQAP